MPTNATLLWRGTKARCPICNEGGVFRGWFSLNERCSRCRLRFERQDGQFVGAVGINTIVTFGLLLVLIVVVAALTAPDIPVGPLLGAGLAIAIIVPIVLYPVSHTLWLAIDLIMRPLDDEEAPGRSDI